MGAVRGHAVLSIGPGAVATRNLLSNLVALLRQQLFVYRDLKHLGLSAAPARATLSYANEHRPWQLYQTVFQQLLEKCQQVVASAPGKKKRKFRFKNKLLSLDATVIALCASIFDWAQFRRSKGAVKLHLLLDHDGHLPCFAVVTEGKQHEMQVARQLHFAPETPY